MTEGERRLAAVMFTDMAGFTALGQKDEALAMELLEEQRGLVRRMIVRYNGREVKTIGDAFLVEFPSSLEAVKCAVEIQSSLRSANENRSEDKKILLRIGIHLGDVIHTGTDLGGDAVNVASRIEPLAPVGGICISAQVHDSVANKAGCNFETLGVQELKNVTEPMEVYWVQGYGVPTARPTMGKWNLPRERVAVLPFVNVSPDPNDEYFADGLTEELIGKLSRVRGLEVIARTSVMNYKKKEKSVSQIGKELNVGTILEGSVRKAGNRIRVAVQLVDANTEGYSWGSNYDRNLEDIFDVQSEIAERVARELELQLLQSEKRMLEKESTKNTEAYNYFLRGRELFRTATGGPIRQAAELFEKAVELDPSFARAYVGVAECHEELALMGLEPWEVSKAIVGPLLVRAVALDPDLPEAHSALSLMQWSWGSSSEAEKESRRALELNPNLPYPYFILSLIAGLRGEPDEMVRLTETAYRLDPTEQSYIGQVGRAYYYTGRDKKMLEHWSRTEKLAPIQTYAAMAEYWLAKGDLGKAEEFHAKAEKLRSDYWWIIALGGMIAAHAGDREKALRAIKKIEGAKMDPLGLNGIAFIYYSLGDLDSYFEYLDKANEAEAADSIGVMYSPLLASARTDSRYEELLKKFREDWLAK